MRYLIVGHNEEEPGAIAYNNEEEYYFALDLVRQIDLYNDFITTEAKNISYIDTLNLRLDEKVQVLNEIGVAGDSAISIHFNNNNTKATGTEVFIDPRSTNKNKDFGSKLVNITSEALDIPLRRSVGARDYKHPDESYVGSLAILEDTILPTVLLEVCFLNHKDLRKYFKYKMELIKGIWAEL